MAEKSRNVRSARAARSASTTVKGPSARIAKAVQSASTAGSGRNVRTAKADQYAIMAESGPNASTARVAPSASTGGCGQLARCTHTLPPLFFVCGKHVCARCYKQQRTCSHVCLSMRARAGLQAPIPLPEPALPPSARPARPGGQAERDRLLLPCRSRPAGASDVNEP